MGARLNGPTMLVADAARVVHVLWQTVGRACVLWQTVGHACACAHHIIVIMCHRMRATAVAGCGTHMCVTGCMCAVLLADDVLDFHAASTARACHGTHVQI